MWELQESEDFDGVTFVLGDEEYDHIMWALVRTDETYDKGGTSNADVKDLIDAMTEDVRFDRQNGAVHCALGYREMSILVSIILWNIPEEVDEEYNFDALSTRPGAKSWED